MIIACLIVRAKLAEAHHDRRAALAALRQALAIAPDDVLARDMLCRLLFTAGDTAAAAVELARLVELDAANPSAQHNLGIARLQIGDFAGAARSLETSLRLRPTYDPTRRALAHARQMLGSFDHQNGRRALQEDGPPGPSPRMVTAWAGHPTPMPDREAKP